MSDAENPRLCEFCGRPLNDPVSLDALTRDSLMHPACNDQWKNPRAYTANERRDFTDAYIVAAVWSAGSPFDDDDPRAGDELDSHYDVDDIEPATIAAMAWDCHDFMHEDDVQPDLIALFDNPDLYGPRGAQWSAAELAGHDFSLTRNGHGAGFWDRGLGDRGERLTKAAKTHGSYNLFPNGDTIYGEDG